MCGLQYLNRGRKNEDHDEKLISFGYSLIFFGLLIDMLLVIINDFLMPGIYINSYFYGNYETGDFVYKSLSKALFVVSFSHNIMFYYAFERMYKRTKYSITLLSSFVVILFVMIPQDVLIIIGSLYFIIYMFIFLTIMVIYTKWSHFELKAATSFIFLGSVMIILTSPFITEAVKALNAIPTILTPILMTIGTICCMIPTIIELNSLSKPLFLWKINGGLSIIFSITIVLISFIISLPIEYSLISLIYPVVIVVLVSYIIKSIQTENRIEKIDSFKDVLGVWSKPRAITEEEVSISKEKKICLVCKGKVVRFNSYICECDTLYCEKCARELSDLENACWVCNAPFDQSKPSKPFKKEEDIKVEEFEEPQKEPKRL